jgi:transcriptional regulator with XRE-family HTH domain
VPSATARSKPAVSTASQLNGWCGLDIGRVAAIATAGRAIGASESKVSRIECGKNRVSDDDLHELLALYQVTDRDERQAIFEFASRLAKGQWWDEYSTALDGWFCSYLVLESIAQHIRTYEVRYVPGLLQTRAYAEAVVRLHAGDKDEIERRVAVRMQRQRMLLERKRPQLWAVIDRTALDEAALPDGVAGPEVMREQIQFLIDAANRPNIVIQTLPPGGGARLGIDNSFSLLRLRLQKLPGVAYLEHIGDAYFLDDPNRADRYEIAMNQLTLTAQRPAQSIETLQQALASIEATSAGHR